MEEAKIPMLKLGPITFNLTLLAVCIVTIAIVFAFVFWASRQMKLKPEGKQTALEYLISFVDGIGEEHLDHNLQKSYSLLLFTIFLFVAVANNLGLFTKLETVNGYNLWTSPTANLAFDLALSLFITLMVHIEGVRRRGLVAHLKRLATPWPMTPMNLLEEFTNFLSLAIRLFGNIFAGEVVTGLIVQLANYRVYWWPIAFLVNMAWTAFSVFISCIQAFVFTKLTATYIGKKVNESEE
ncbi:F0F1 ATP synthase subunit A [Streptococcus dysgalactiae subsp. equisimilis]|uniref:F0F1 ATP synthase subunit A n=1 Tax=Streptococcus dysgalactiae TaxID=1334 RepID=UPI00194EA425|nr:F0F1 ATP synthase subunit A [Streptococcus dysgalactiae]MBM6533235.1 F0F1 ATP synthase subunit A [Streptococcus dysgalactiae subsp. equisimilis]